jgi:anaerobic magnesium-protoporphyrin IX monomethyl ester cyclase
MAELLLTHGYFLFEDPKELQIMKPYAPLGILYLCSHLRNQGYDVDVFDTTFSSREALFQHLRSETPSVIGIYANLMTRGNVVETLKVAREAGWKTIVGGPEPGAYALEYLQAGASFVVFGEGELTMQDLLAAFRAGVTDIGNTIPGLAYLDAAGNMHETAQREQIADLDKQPWPARQAIDVSRYVKTWRDAHGKGSVNFITARGCPYKCRWCSHQVFGQTHRRRDPLLVVDEVEWLLSTYSPDMVWVSDDVFTINHKWLRDYATEMRRRGLRIPFECISRADRLNAEMLDLLAELGCFRVWIGSESGSQRILDSMDRGVKVEQVQQAVALTRERGIESGMFLMWGYEGEELDDIEATIKHVSTSQPDIFFTTVSYPIKGTPYYKKVSDRLVQLKPWGVGSDREIKIKGRHSRTFYSYADKLLKDEVQLARLLGTSGANSDLAATFTESLIGRAQRDAVWSRLARIFHSGDHILELNCGTGEDALFLARNAISVTACDASEQMIQVARQRLRSEAPDAPVEFHLLPTEQIESFQEIKHFDGALSNFSGLNCIADLAKTAESLATLLYPKASLLVCLSTRFCLWEMVWYSLHGNLRKAFRRTSGKATAVVGQYAVDVYYPNVRNLQKTFSPYFELRSITGIGITVPPSYVERWIRRYPKLLKALRAVDKAICTLPGIRVLGDHVLLHFERTQP